MVTIRNAKAKGSCFEYDTLESLQAKFPDMYLTSKQGFVQQYDLIDDQVKIAVECKRHKGFSWNELVKLYNKLMFHAPRSYTCYLIIKGNRQPTLVMYNRGNGYVMKDFEDLFGIPFIKHTPIRRKQNV